MKIKDFLQNCSHLLSRNGYVCFNEHSWVHCQQREIATGCMPAFKILLVKGINFGLDQKCIELLPILKLCV